MAEQEHLRIYGGDVELRCWKVGPSLSTDEVWWVHDRECVGAAPGSGEPLALCMNPITPDVPDRIKAMVAKTEELVPR